MKKTVFTRIDTTASAPSNQGAIIRVWDRSWRLRGWGTRICLSDEVLDYATICIPYTWINFSQKKFDSHFRAEAFGSYGWLDAPVVIFPADVSEQEILECGRSLAS